MLSQLSIRGKVDHFQLGWCHHILVDQLVPHLVMMLVLLAVGD